MKILLLLYILFCSISLCLGQKNAVLIDSLAITFQNKLFSVNPFIQKSQDKFFFYDFVSEKLVVADEKLHLLKDTTASAGKGRRIDTNAEVKLLYRAMYVIENEICFYSGSVRRYGKESLGKQATDKLSPKHPNPALKNHPVADLGFLVEEDGKKRRYIIRQYAPFATPPTDYLETYTKGFYQRPTYALYEKEVEDTTMTPIKKMIIPYDKIYQEKYPLGYVHSQNIAFGKKGTVITTEGATEKMRIYTTEGKEIDELGEKGKFMTAKDTISFISYQDSSKAFWDKMQKKIQYHQLHNPIYGKAYYDAKADHIYREYYLAVGEGETRKRFMQVYHKKKLIADVPFPLSHYIIAIENGIFWTYQVNSDGETPPNYIYKLKIQ